jgi:hypothetical protein
MFKYTITFQRENGTAFKVAYRAGSKKEAIFFCSNELAKCGEINLRVISTIEHALI